MLCCYRSDLLVQFRDARAQGSDELHQVAGHGYRRLDHGCIGDCWNGLVDFLDALLDPFRIAAVVLRAKGSSPVHILPFPDGKELLVSTGNDQVLGSTTVTLYRVNLSTQASQKIGKGSGGPRC